MTLTATIGKDGTIKAVKVVSGHPMLVAAASEAVKQWRYRPTLLNGQPWKPRLRYWSTSSETSRRRRQTRTRRC